MKQAEHQSTQMIQRLIAVTRLLTKGNQEQKSVLSEIADQSTKNTKRKN